MLTSVMYGQPPSCKDLCDGVNGSLAVMYPAS
jgi:hypothetical protein